jgi:hypothetical protein
MPDATDIQITNTGVPVSSDVPQMQKPQWHYYMKRNGIYRLKKNTGDDLKISGEDYASSVAIAEDWIFFRDGDCLYRMDEEDRRELLLDEICYRLCIQDGWIYFSNGEGVFRIKPDGSEMEHLIYSNCTAMALTEEFIFYVEYEPVDDSDYNEDGPPLAIGKLHRSDINGKDDIGLEQMVTDLNAYGNYVYFSDAKDYYYYRMDPDTTKTTVFYRGHFILDPCFGGDFVYFVSERSLHRANLSSGAVERFSDVIWPRCNGIIDGYVYVTTYQDNLFGPGIYRMEIDGTEFELVDVIEFGGTG